MLAPSTSRILVNGTVKGKNFAFYRKERMSTLPQIKEEYSIHVKAHK